MFHDSKEVTVGKNEIFNCSPGKKFNIENFVLLYADFVVARKNCLSMTSESGVFVRHPQ